MPVCRNPMSGTALRMVSPSSSSTMRSTPCVEGCCGPMFRIIRLLVLGAAICSTVSWVASDAVIESV